MGPRSEKVSVGKVGLELSLERAVCPGSRERALCHLGRHRGGKQAGQEGNRKASMCAKHYRCWSERSVHLLRVGAANQGRRDMGFAVRKLWAGNLSVPLSSCVTTGTSLTFSQPQSSCV